MISKPASVLTKPRPNPWPQFGKGGENNRVPVEPLFDYYSEAANQKHLAYVYWLSLLRCYRGREGADFFLQNKSVGTREVSKKGRSCAAVVGREKCAACS